MLTPPKKECFFTSYSALGKAYLTVATLESLALVVICILGLANAKNEPPILQFMSILGLWTTFLFIYFSWDSVHKENVFQFWASVSMHIFIFMFVIWHYFSETLGSLFNRYRLSLTILTGACQLIYVIMTPFMHNSFGWRLYKRVGGNIEMQKMYRVAHIFFALLKFDVGVEVLLVLLASFFLFESTFSYEAILNGVALIVTVVWAIVGRQTVRTESARLVKFWAAFAFVEPIYILYKFAQMNLVPVYKDSPRTTYFQFYLLGSIALIIRAVLLYFAYRAYKNFGKGLAESVFAKKAGPKRTFEPRAALLPSALDSDHMGALHDPTGGAGGVTGVTVSAPYAPPTSTSNPQGGGYYDQSSTSSKKNRRSGGRPPSVVSGHVITTSTGGPEINSSGSGSASVSHSGNIPYANATGGGGGGGGGDDDAAHRASFDATVNGDSGIRLSSRRSGSGSGSGVDVEVPRRRRSKTRQAEIVQQQIGSQHFGPSGASAYVGDDPYSRIGVDAVDYDNNDSAQDQSGPAGNTSKRTSRNALGGKERRRRSRSRTKEELVAEREAYSRPAWE